MISIDIDGPSTMLSSICESLVITQGTVYSSNIPKSDTEPKSDSLSHPISSQYEEYLLQTSYPIKKDKIEVLNSWHDHTIINGSSTSWRSSFKPVKQLQQSRHSVQTYDSSSSSSNHGENNSLSYNKQQKTTRDTTSSPILLHSEKQYRTTGTSPITVPVTFDQSCQYSPPLRQDRNSQCSLETKASSTQVSSYDLPGFLQTQDGIQTNDNLHLRTILVPPRTLERSADSGILVDDNHRMKSNLALQVDLKSSSSDSEDISEVTTRPILRQTPLNNNMIYENTVTVKPNLSISTADIEQQILQLRRERAHVLELLSLNWNRSNIWVELTEAKLNYIIGETGN